MSRTQLAIVSDIISSMKVDISSVKVTDSNKETLVYFFNELFATSSGGPPIGPAGGDLTGTYPNPTLAAVGVAGIYGSTLLVPQITTDSKGRVTGVNELSIAFPVTSVNGRTGAVPLTGTANRISISALNVFDIGTDVVTLSAAQALSNKTGLISQWSNDSLYATPTSATAFTNKTGNISQWTNDTGYFIGTPTLAQTLASGRNVDATGRINTSAGSFAIDVNAGTFYSTTFLNGTLNWNSAELYSGSGGTSLNWNSRSLFGTWTTTGSLLFDGGGGIDTILTVGTDTLSIGVTNANVINYGNSSTVHNFLGTAIYELQVNSYVQDKVITLNYGGAISSGVGVGFEIQENSAITGYLKTNGTRNGFSFLAPANTAATTLIFQASIARDVTFQDVAGTVYVSTGTDVTLLDGGTNASLVASLGGIFYSTASAGAILAGTVTAGQMLRSGASAAPTWSTTTWPTTTTINRILWSSAANVISDLATVNSGILITSSGGVPSIDTDIPTAITIGTAYIYRVGGTDVAITDGGTGQSTATLGFNALSPVTTRGDIIVRGVTNNDRLGLGTVGKILRSDGTDLVYSTNTYPNTTGVGQVLYATSANIIGSSAEITYAAVGSLGTLFSAIAASAASKNVGFYAQNTTNSGQASILFENDRGSLAAYGGIIYGSTANAIGNLFGVSRPDKMFIFADGASNLGLYIGTLQTQPLVFGTNNTEQARFLSTGEFIIGGTSLVGGELLSVQKNQNAGTRVYVRNTTSGTASYANLALESSSGLNLNLNVISALFTSSGINVASTSVINTGSSGGLNIGTIGSAQLSFWTNNTNRWQINSSGHLLGVTDNTYDIGIAGATRPRTIYAGTTLISPLISASDAAPSYNLLVSGFAHNYATTIYTRPNAAGTISYWGGSSGSLLNLGITNTTSTAGIYLYGLSNAQSGTALTVGPIVLISGKRGTTAPIAVESTDPAFDFNNSGTGFVVGSLLMRLLGGGQLIVGATGLVNAEKFLVRNDANSGTYTGVYNGTSGTAAYAQTFWTASGARIYVGALNTSYTTSGMNVAGSAAVSSDAGVLMIIGNYHAAPITFWTNSTEKMRINSAGEIGIGKTAASGITIDVLGGTTATGTIASSAAATNGSSRWQAVNDTGLTADLCVLSSTYTTNGVLQASRTLITSSTTTGVIYGCTVSGPVLFITGGITAANERARILSNGQFLIGRTTSINGTSDILTLEQNANSSTDLWINNTTSGTAARSLIALTNNTGTTSLAINSISAGYTTSGIVVADAAVIYTNKAAGFNIGTTAATQLSFWTNNTQKAIIESGGNFVVGTTASIGTNNIANFRKDINATVYVTATNTTSGLSGVVGFVSTTSATASTEMSMYATSAGYTTSGLYAPNMGVLYTNQTGGMNIGCQSNAAIGFYTNNTLRMTIMAVGNVKIAGTAVRATTEGTNHLDIFDGTAPVGTLANGCSFYSTAGEMRVMDAAGNATLLSPHEKKTNYWIYDSVDTVNRKRLKIDMEKMMKAINEKFGWDFVHEFEVK